MVDDLEVFIVSHDQNIIVDYENKKKFSDLPLYRYLFVGSGDTNLIKNNKKVIICRDLPNNIEDDKLLVSFTSWYALAKNNLVKTKYVSILEYDIDLYSDFYKKNLDCLRRNPEGFIGYVVYPLNNPLFLYATPWFPSSVEKIYSFSVLELINKHIQTTGKNSWCSTSNRTLSYDNLKSFVDWFYPITTIFKHDKLGAHVHERCLTVFTLMSNKKNFYIPGVLRHWQKKSHKIEALLG